MLPQNRRRTKQPSIPRILRRYAVRVEGVPEYPRQRLDEQHLSARNRGRVRAAVEIVFNKWGVKNPKLREQGIEIALRVFSQRWDYISHQIDLEAIQSRLRYARNLIRQNDEDATDTLLSLGVSPRTPLHVIERHLAMTQQQL